MSNDNDPTTPPSPPVRGEVDPLTLSDYDAPVLIKREKLFTKGTMALAALLIGAGGFTLGGYLKNTPAATAATTQRTNTNATGRAATTGATGTTGTAGRATATGATGAAAAGTGGGFGGGSTIGQITVIAANAITVQDSQGNLVKITTSATTPINIAKTGAVSDLSVGETIVVQGASNADGSINPTAINAGSAFATRGGRGGGSAATGAGAGASATTSGATATPRTGTGTSG